MTSDSRLSPECEPADWQDRAGVRPPTAALLAEASFNPLSHPIPKGLSPSDQIAFVWEKCSRYGIWARRKGREDLLQLRIMRVTRMYRELAAAGHFLADVDAFREEHAGALLDAWRCAGRVPSTIRGDWSILRVWCEALGRPGELKPLRHYWPDAPKANTPPDPLHPPSRHQDASLLNLLRSRPDRTHYCIEVLCRQLRLTQEEAMLLPLDTLQALVAGDQVDHRKIAAARKASPQDVQHAASQVVEYLVQVQRDRLLWPAVTLPQAVRRHGNHLAYLRRQIRCGLLPSKKAREGGSQTKRFPCSEFANHPPNLQTETT